MKKTLAVMFAALSVASFGCNKSKTDTANPDEAKPVEGAPAEGGDKAGEEKPAEGGTPAEGSGDAAAAPTP